MRAIIVVTILALLLTGCESQEVHQPMFANYAIPINTPLYSPASDLLGTIIGDGNQIALALTDVSANGTFTVSRIYGRMDTDVSVLVVPSVLFSDDAMEVGHEVRDYVTNVPPGLSYAVSPLTLPGYDYLNHPQGPYQLVNTGFGQGGFGPFYAGSGPVQSTAVENIPVDYSGAFDIALPDVVVPKSSTGRALYVMVVAPTSNPTDVAQTFTLGGVSGRYVQ